MNGQPFNYITPRPANHWLNRTYPERPLTLGRAALYFFIIAALTFGLAYLFVRGWDLQHDIDLGKTRAHIESLLYDLENPTRSQGRKLPTWGADGPAYSSGHEYFKNKKELNR